MGVNVFVMSFTMSRTLYSQTHGNGISFHCSKYGCWQSVNEVSTVPSSWMTAVWNWSPKRLQQLANLPPCVTVFKKLKSSLNYVIHILTFQMVGMPSSSLIAQQILVLPVCIFVVSSVPVTQVRSTLKSCSLWQSCWCGCFRPYP